MISLVIICLQGWQRVYKRSDGWIFPIRVAGRMMSVTIPIYDGLEYRMTILQG